VAPTYQMACLLCGARLAENGSCPHCGAGSAPPSLHAGQVGRERATWSAPTGGALVSGRVDRLGVFQAAGRRINWFVRISAVSAAIVVGLAVGALILAAILALVGGAWILPHGGLAAVVGLVVVLVSVGVLLVVGAMLWLLVRRDTQPRPGSYGSRRI